MPPGGAVVFETPPTPSDENHYRFRNASRMSRSRSFMRFIVFALLRLLLNCSRLRVSPATICFMSCSVMVIYPFVPLAGCCFLLPELTGLALLLCHRVSGGGLA